MEEQDKPRTTFRLLKDFRPPEGVSTEISELRRQLDSVPGFEAVQLAPQGASTVVASVPAQNKRQKDQLRSVLAKSVRGWRVVDDTTYRVPATL